MKTTKKQDLRNSGLRTKGQYFEHVFGKEYMRKCDYALPLGSVKPDETFYFVMDYNNNIFGRLLDIREHAIID